MKELRKLNVEHILCTEDTNKINAELQLHKESLLVLDLTIGLDEASDILRNQSVSIERTPKSLILWCKNLIQKQLGSQTTMGRFASVAERSLLCKSKKIWKTFFSLTKLLQQKIVLLSMKLQI